MSDNVKRLVDEMFERADAQVLAECYPTIGAVDAGRAVRIMLKSIVGDLCQRIADLEQRVSAIDGVGMGK